MNIPLFVLFVVLFSTELFIMYDMIKNSEQTIRSVMFCILIFVFSFSVVYLVATFEIAQTILKITFAIYGALLLLSFVVGNIVIIFNRKIGETIASFFHTIVFWLLFLLPCIPPICFYFAVGIIG